MISIHLKKGYDLNVAGKPSRELKTLPPPDQVALLPDKLPFVKPRLTVKTGDRVQVGSVLFEDKANPGVKFVSPGGGTVVDIQYGPRRVIEAVVIRLDGEEAFAQFPPIPENRIADVARDKLAAALVDGGVWPLIRELPFRNIPRPDTQMPSAVFVDLSSEEPFQPVPGVYLRDRADLLRYGAGVLRRLAKRVIVSIADRDADLLAETGLEDAPDCFPIRYRGHYPAGDPGVLLYRTKRTAKENRSWFIHGQDLLLLAGLLRDGVFPTERTVVVGGTGSPVHGHIRTRIGAPLAHLLGGAGPNGDTRYIQGGLLSGYAAPREGHLGLYETGLTLIPEGRERELFGFIRPGYSKPSYSRAFLSVFHTAPFERNCNTHGEERACINCGYCAHVCPVDILPQYTMKALRADEIEEALALGLLDCVECGLCTYVCPSKLELYQTLKNAKARYHQEMNR